MPTTPTPDNDAEALLARVAELEADNARLRNARKFGIVWEEQEDKRVECELAGGLPVLVRRPSLDVRGVDPTGLPHVLIEGDNLHALTVLQATHANSVDVIYIDPPYNTGKEFVYNDRLVGKDDRWRHSAWLSFMDKRLRLAHALLKDTGVVFISIDDNEQAHLRLLCDQVFGPGGFLGQFIWQKKYGGGNDARQFVTEHEYVLAYARNASSVGAFLVKHDERYLRRYKESDERGRFFWDTLARPGLTGAISVTLSDAEGPVTILCGVSQRTADEMLSKGDIRIVRKADGTASVQFKQRLAEGKRMRSIIQKSSTGVGGTSDGKSSLTPLVGDGLFDYPKPVELVQHLVSACLPSNGVVLDFFAGSGTTAQAVAQLNAEDGGSRQAILVTNNENDICRTVTQPRIKAVLTGKWADGQQHDALPGSLKFYTTGFLRNRRNRDQALIDLAKAAADILAVKDGAHDKALEAEFLTVLRGQGKTCAVVTDSFSDHSELASAAEAVAGADDERVAYLFTWADDGIEPEVATQWPGWDVRPLPAPLMAAIRRGINAARSAR